MRELRDGGFAVTFSECGWFPASVPAADADVAGGNDFGDDNASDNGGNASGPQAANATQNEDD